MDRILDAVAGSDDPRLMQSQSGPSRITKAQMCVRLEP